MPSFISWLPEVDRIFPAREFPSSGPDGDMVHPRLVIKFCRYGER